MIKPGSSKAYAQVNQQNLISHTLQKRQRLCVSLQKLESRNVSLEHSLVGSHRDELISATADRFR